MVEFRNDINKALELLRAGGIILFPTDTGWKLGCDATNENAVKRLFEIKKATDPKEMVVLIDHPAKLQGYVNEIPEMAWDLIEMSEKPLTIIYADAKNLAANILGKDKSVRIRVTKEIFSKTLCERFRKPVVSTSANISGSVQPANFQQISEDIKLAVDYIVTYRQNELNKPTASSIVKLDKGNVIKIVRQ
ncbi:MAG: L-threonylcarbamoyladenylate synthase [Paludibacter sp.]|nr:L-threonylcarbamoyladenylate synthase [Paludibacter sp.]